MVPIHSNFSFVRVILFSYIKACISIQVAITLHCFFTLQHIAKNCCKSTRKWQPFCSLGSWISHKPHSIQIGSSNISFSTIIRNLEIFHSFSFFSKLRYPSPISPGLTLHTPNMLMVTRLKVSGKFSCLIIQLSSDVTIWVRI